jgi:predicted small lipoprotein YifL
MKTRILLFITLAAVVLLAACKGKSGPYEFVNNSKSANADSATGVDTTPSTPKLVKTAEMHFKVRNVQRAKDSIISLTKLYGGMVMHHQVQSSAEQSKDLHISNDSIQRISVFSTNADMTVKIPSEKLEEFMTKVGHMGLYVNISRMDIEDKSLDYLSSQLKLNSRKELISQQKKGKVIIKDPSSVLYLKDDLVDEQIGNRKIDDAVKYSIISLNFYQSNTISTENIANDDPSAYNVPLFQRLCMAFGNGWNIFIDVMVGLANLWVFIIAGTVLWRGIVYYKSRSRTINTPVA